MNTPSLLNKSSQQVSFKLPEDVFSEHSDTSEIYDASDIMSQPQMSQPQMSQPQMSQPQMSQPQMPQPQIPQPQMPQPQIPQPQMSQPQMPQHNMPQPQMSQPQMSQHNMPQPQMSQPQMPQTDNKKKKKKSHKHEIMIVPEVEESTNFMSKIKKLINKIPHGRTILMAIFIVAISYLYMKLKKRKQNKLPEESKEKDCNYDEWKKNQESYEQIMDDLRKELNNKEEMSEDNDTE